MRSPWGRVLKGDPRGRGRRPQPRQERLRLQDAVADHRRRDRRARPASWSRCGSAAINPSLFATDTTFFAYTVLLIGGAARVLGPVAGAMIFWFLITFLDLFFGQATTQRPDPLIPTGS